MKKVLALLLSLILIFALSACGKEDTSSDTDTSAPTSTTETTSEPADNSSEEDTDKETEGGTSDTGTPTESSKPADNSKPTDTSKPDNSKPTETSKPTTNTTTPSTPTHTHSWSEWKIETKAFVGKDGTEKRTCSSCKETESRTHSKEASYNSFYDVDIDFLFVGTSKINANNLILYFSQKYEGRNDATITPSSATVFDWLSSRFTLTNSLKDEMKQDARYNSATDTFTLNFEGHCGDVSVLGYVKNGSKYTVYYLYEPYGSDERINWKVELEYNQLNGKPNKYLSMETVTSIPSNITK